MSADAGVDTGVLARRLIEASARGAPDPDAEDRLCRALAPRIRRYGLRHARRFDAAADLVQEVLLLVLGALRSGRLSDPEGLTRFVLAACRNFTFEANRRDHRRARILAEHGLEAVPSWPAPEAASAVDLERLSRCLGALEDRDRTVLELTFFDDLAAERIGERLALTEGNVRVVRHRALLRLRACVDGGGS